METEKALARMSQRQSVMENILIGSLLVNLAGFASKEILRKAGIAGAAFLFDKTQAKLKAQNSFVEEEVDDY